MVHVDSKPPALTLISLVVVRRRETWTIMAGPFAST